MRFTFVLFVSVALCSTPVFASEDASEASTGTPLHSMLDALKAGAHAIHDVAMDTSLLSPESPTLHRSLSASYFGLSLMDWQTTTVALGAGGAEGNILMAGIASHPATFLLTKVAVAGATLYMTEQLRKHHPKAALATLVAANSAMLMVVAHNASVIRVATP